MIDVNKQVKRITYNGKELPLVGSEPTVLANATFTSNGTYRPTNGVNGFASVTVNVDTKEAAIIGIIERDNNAPPFAVPEGTKRIGEDAFSGVQSIITLPDSITEIAYQAFWNANGFRSTTLPASLKTIGKSAFSACYGIRSIEIPASVETIGDYAFSGCENLLEVTFKGKPTSFGSQVFANTHKYITIRVPWSAGEVSGFPGYKPENATIIYNYTE